MPYMNPKANTTLQGLYESDGILSANSGLKDGRDFKRAYQFLVSSNIVSPFSVLCNLYVMRDMILPVKI